MSNNINDKTSPDQMRILMKRMRTGSDGKCGVSETPEVKKVLSIKDMLKITRKLNEDVDGEAEKPVNKETVYDQPEEEAKFQNFFNDMPVSVKFIDLEVNNNLVFWGGTVNGIIQFIYKVTPDEATSGVEFNYLDDFSPDNPDNDLIIKMIESYYDTFYKYWRNNMLQQ
jgi:hypothetical protein